MSGKYKSFKASRHLQAYLFGILAELGFFPAPNLLCEIANPEISIGV